jgi:hypothetical protein
VTPSFAKRYNDRVADDPADEIAKLTRRLDLLVEMLIGRGVLQKNDARILKLAGESAARPHVKLAVIRDKHAIVSPDIDCAAHLHLCQARCCSFRVRLDPDEVREGKLRWELEDPYNLARARDGYCAHLREGEGGGCEHYADRPATCREYDCSDDKRVWLDYEQRIPAPMPEGVRGRF